MPLSVPEIARPDRAMSRRPALRIAALMLAGTFLAGSNAAFPADQCNGGSGVALQVLGSGGPIADDGRSSAAYIVWVGGESKIMVDVGGGAFLRFGEAGARFDELEHIAVSHFHTDHSADLVTLLKTGYFSDRERGLGISGPGRGGPFPSLKAYLESLVGVDGAYAYLSGYLDGSGGLVKLTPVEIDPARRAPVAVVGSPSDSIEITAVGVPHGIVPTIAYRVRVADTDIVFASDQNGNAPEFAEFARDADVLVMHMVVPEGVTGAGRALHAPPSRIGEIAGESGAATLVLSHFMARSLEDIDGNVALVRRHFDGDIVLAEDLLCISPAVPAANRAARVGRN
jgi:ribonuclease BN (tRNA processing enzyme)